MQRIKTITFGLTGVVLAFIVTFLLYRIPLVYIGIFSALLSFGVFILFTLKSKSKLKRREIKLNYEPKISIIIPAKNEEKVIERTLKTTLEMEYSNFEVIAVDDGSDDRTNEICKTFLKDDRVKLITIPKKNPIHGKLNALFEAFKLCSGEFILIIDADCLLPKDYLKKMIVDFQRDENVWGVQSAIKVYNKENLVSEIAAADIDITNLFMWLLLPGRSFGTGFIFRREVLKYIDYTRRKTFCDDCVITSAITKNDKRIVYNTFTYISQSVPAKWKVLFKQRKRWFFGMLKEYAFQRKYFEIMATLFISTLSLILHVLVFIPKFNVSHAVLLLYILFIYSSQIFSDKAIQIKNPLRTVFFSLISYFVSFLVMIYSFFLITFGKELISWYKTER